MTDRDDRALGSPGVCLIALARSKLKGVFEIAWLAANNYSMETSSTDTPQEVPRPETAVSAATAPPRAEIVHERRWSWAWLAPIAAAVFVAVMAYRSWQPAGPTIVIHFAEGHGLKPGDVVRHRGVVAGEVRDVRIAADLSRIDVAVNLRHEAAPIARHGSRFWIVRPRIDFASIEGLDTLVGPHYIAVLPGEGPAQTEFIGHEEAPLTERIEPGGVEVVLQAAERGGLRPGAAVYYRQFRVGTVLSVGLAADGSAVEARAYVRPPFRELIRERSKFWNVGGIELDAGWLKGLSIEVAAAEDLLRGGVAFATPEDGGAVVVDGHRFEVSSKADEVWRAWSPSLPLAGQVLGESQPAPAPSRAVLTWKHDGTFHNPERRREGYVLRTPKGFLGPADLLTTPEKAFSESAQVAISGRAYPVNGESMRLYSELALLPATIGKDDKLPPWPDDRIRNPSAPEDCLAFIRSTGEPRPIAAARCEDQRRCWSVDPIIPFDADWHGASIVAVQDGKLIGFLAWQDDHAEILPLRASTSETKQ